MRSRGGFVACILFFWLLLSLDLSASDWVRQNRTIVGSVAQDMHWFTAQVGIAVGEKGVFRTTDGGLSWVATLANPAPYLQSVDFIDASTGWVVGKGGKVLKSTDGGLTWQAQTSGVTDDLESVDFVDGTDGWAVGGESVLKTTNGGGTWSKVKTGSYNAVRFTNKNHGVIVGGVASADVTDDGGTTWTPFSLIQNGSALVYDVFFASDQVGWAVGLSAWRISYSCDPFGGCGWDIDDPHSAVWKTTDGGHNWVRTHLTSTSEFLEHVFFVDQTKGWIVGGRGSIYATTDGGASWTPQTSGVATGLYSTYFVTAQQGWATGQAGVLLATTDAGSSWATRGGSRLNDLEDVFAFDAQTAWAVGESGTILYTGNGGSSWVAQPSGTSAWLYEAHFATRQIGWVVGADGTVLKTTDGGNTWSSKTVGTDTLYSVCFVDANKGWVVGKEIYGTTDGGSTWQSQFTPTWASGYNHSLSSIYALDSQRAWAVGDNAICRTTNGGQSWQQQLLPDDVSLRTVHFVDPFRGWAAGPGDDLFRTMDGGAVWRPQADPPNCWDIFFADVQTGWAAAYSIAKTTDGGVTWSRTDLGTSVFAIAVADAQVAWAVGDDGAIFRTANLGAPLGPQVAIQPQGAVIPSGGTATMNVGAAGRPPFSYQWYMGVSGNTANPVPGATFVEFTTPPLTSTTGYWVSVSNAHGSAQSATVTVTVISSQCQTPMVQTQPQDVAIQGGQTATFSVTATGCTPISYQWYQGNSGNTFQPIADAVDSTFTTMVLSRTSNYWVRITNPYGSTNSRTATATVNCPAPIITVQPQGGTANKGGSYTLSVTATGTTPISYQWYRGPLGDTSQPIDWPRDSSYTVYNLTETVTFWVRVTDLCSSVDSQAATVIVQCLNPVVSSQTRGLRTQSGQRVTLRVTVTDPANRYPTYEWYKGQSGDTSRLVSGATWSSYTTPPLTSSTSYWARASNECGNVDSDTFLITVQSAQLRWQGLGPLFKVINVVGVAPADPNILFAGTEKGVFKSTDAGKEWAPAGISSIDREVSGIGFDSATPSIVYATVLYSGVYKSTDGGANWARLGSGAPTSSVNGLRVDPQDPRIIYVTAYYNGVYKSTDSGATWRQVNSGIGGTSSKYLSSLAIDPQNPAVLYATTSNSSETGVYKSTNRGDSWTASGSGITSTYMARVAVDPTNSNLLYAATDDGIIYKSTNGGTSWTEAHSMASTTALLSVDGLGRVFAGTGGALFRSTDHGTTWAPMGTASGSGDLEHLTYDPQTSTSYYLSTQSGVYKSTDVASTWTPSRTGLNGGAVYSVAVHPTQPLVVYAGTGKGLYRTTDRGKSWTPAVTGIDQYDSVANVLVDPQTPATLYATTYDAIMKSTDSGANWSPLSSGVSGGVSDLAMSPEDSAVLYACGSSGVRKSTDRGATWAAVNNGLGSATVASLRPVGASTVFAATSSGLFRSTDSGAGWQSVSEGTSLGTSYLYDVAVDPSDSSVIYAASTFDIHRTTDGGAHWTEMSSPGEFGTTTDILLCDPRFANTLYAGTGDGVYKSTDGASSWVAINDGLSDLSIEALVIDPNSLYGLFAGTEYGGAFKSDLQTTIFLPFFQKDQATFTGYAVSNPAITDVELLFTGYRSDGSLLIPASTNPASRSLGGNAQLAILGHDLLGSSADSQAGWIETQTSAPVGSFFQFGRWDIQQMDGSVAFQGWSERLYFSRVFQGPTALRGRPASTRIVIVNPTTEPVTVTVRLFGPTPGVQLAPEQVRTIPSKGYLQDTVDRLFSVNNVSSGFITVEVTQGSGVIGFELIEISNVKTIIGLNASFGNPFNRQYSAQLAQVPGIFTSIKLINTARQPRQVILSAWYDDGQAMAPSVTVDLLPGQMLEQEASAVFAFSNGRPAIGTLCVEADGPEVIGDVVFGEPTVLRFAAALPLQNEEALDAVFSQVANGAGLYTGVALFNPGDVAADITIEVFRADGTKSGESQLQLLPRHRTSQLVVEFVAGTGGQIGGYVRIRTSQPIIAQELFGDYAGYLLSAVPPTVLR